MTKVVYGGWTFPAGEAHLPGWMKKVQDKRDGRLLYQGSKYRAAMKFVTKRRGAVDIGGHIGLWSWQMAKDFANVIAFEPMPEHRDCFGINIFGKPDFDAPMTGAIPPNAVTIMTNVTLHPCALGEREGIANIVTRTVGSSGDTGIDMTGTRGIRVPVKTLDSFELNEIDFLKCDCEGFELFVMRGATETLKRNKPVVIVEQKPETGMTKNYNIGVTDAVEYLKTLGYVQREVHAGDYIMTAA